MTEKEIHIKEGEHLSDILSEIEADTILNKTICGIGATHLELTSQRHSIIIEPNVPVIKGKERKHPHIKAVYERVDADSIHEYILEKIRDKGHIKIMTTPESFPKVKRAVKKSGMNLYRQFFMLFDECEKAIQDVDYRKSITLPIDDFFRCERKAMVSATPIPPKDPRFEEQGFTHVKVIPDYEHRKPILLYHTNNISVLMKDIVSFLSENNSSAPVCIFLNSTNAIEKLIMKLGISEQTDIYCGTESMNRLKSHGFTSVYDTLNLSEDGKAMLNRFNFFTSRFYSAVDIELDTRPTVFMITDVYSASHTMIDPETEAVQITGRFRNGVRKIMHITNYDKRIEYMSADETEKYLDSRHRVYEQFMKMKGYVCFDETGSQQTIDQALISVDHARYVTRKGERDWFMYGNMIRDEHIKSLYKSVPALRNAYNKSGAFLLRKSRYIRCGMTDRECDRLNDSQISGEERNRLAFKFMKRLMNRASKRNSMKYDHELLEELSKSFSLVLQAYHALGEERMQEVGFSTNDLKKAIARKTADSRKLQKGVVRSVYNTFSENQWYSSQTINCELGKIFKTHSITIDGRGIAKDIQIYFDADEDNKTASKGWKLKTKLLI